MKAMVDLCVVPIGVGVSVSEYIAAWDREQSMQDKIDSVNRKLGRGVP